MKRLLVLAACLMLLCSSVLAEDTPYGGYTTTAYGVAAPSPVGYVATDFLTGPQMGTSALSKPNDMYTNAETGYIYIADTNNQRIVVLDEELQFVREYLTAGDIAFVSPKGVFADDQGNIYVADDGLGLTVLMDQEGRLLTKFERPISNLYEETMPYTPQKVVADSAGRAYVLSQGIYQGLICYNPDGTFLSFYGANHVELTAKVVIQKLLRVFMTREQRAAMESFIPIEYSNIDIDKDNMVYTSVSTLEQAGGNSVYKLNPLGISYRKFPAGSLIDVLNDAPGYYTCLTKDTKEIFEFSENGTGVMLTCGGNGTQKGLLQDPVAMGRMGEDLLVLDRQTGGITRYQLTTFGRNVHEAMRLTTDGRFQEAAEVFQGLLREDANYTFGYVGLGKVYYDLENYQESMRYYRLANSRQGYSNAFKEYSTELLRHNLGWMLCAIIALFVASKIWGHFRAKTAAKRKASTNHLQPWRHPLYCMLHPYTGFEDVKLHGTGSIGAAAVLVGLLFLSQVVSYVVTGFAFNPNRIEKLNILLLLAGSVGMFMLVYVPSLAVSSLMSDCEGKPSELFIALGYSLLPFILGTFTVAITTNILSLEMHAFVTFFQVFYIAWSLILLILSMMQINQLTFKKTLLYLLLVIIAMVIVLVLIVLLYSLVQQFVVFLKTLYSEIMYRM